MSTTPQEAQAIAEIRANMELMLALAHKRKKYSDELPKELAKNSKSALADMMQEKRQLLYEQYEPINVEVLKQINDQVNYVADRNLAHATAWHDLLEELRPYRTGIGMLEKTL